MRKSDIVISILSLLGLAGLIGPHVLASCLLALGIVATYGISARMLLDPPVGRHLPATVLSATAALGALATGALMVSLWARVLHQPFLWSLALWSAIFAAGSTWALAAMWLEAHGRGPKVLRAVIH
jgi:hypothetical protein